MGGASIPMAGRCRCVDALWCVDADGRSVDPDGSDGCVDAGVGPDWRCVDALWRVDADGQSVDPDGSDGCVDADGRSVHPDGWGRCRCVDALRCVDADAVDTVHRPPATDGGALARPGRRARRPHANRVLHALRRGADAARSALNATARSPTLLAVLLRGLFVVLSVVVSLICFLRARARVCTRLFTTGSSPQSPEGGPVIAWPSLQ